MMQKALYIGENEVMNKRILKSAIIEIWKNTIISSAVLKVAFGPSILVTHRAELRGIDSILKGEKYGKNGRYC